MYICVCTNVLYVHLSVSYSLTFVQVKLFPHTPSHPSHRTDLGRIHNHNRKCTSDRLTVVPAQLQSGSPHRCSSVKQNIHNMMNLFILYVQITLFSLLALYIKYNLLNLNSNKLHFCF